MSVIHQNRSRDWPFNIFCISSGHGFTGRIMEQNRESNRFQTLLLDVAQLWHWPSVLENHQPTCWNGFQAPPASAWKSRWIVRVGSLKIKSWPRCQMTLQAFQCLGWQQIADGRHKIFISTKVLRFKLLHKGCLVTCQFGYCILRNFQGWTKYRNIQPNRDNTLNM